MGQVAVRLEQVSKRFLLDRTPNRTIMEIFTRPFRRRRSREYFWPLRDVSFEVERGQSLGIIGENGSGKSTLLKLIAGILEPTSGVVETHGRVGALLELGTGFHPDLTGRDNIYLNAAILGLRRSEIQRYFDQIVEFADIGQFIDVPVKHYSSGMQVRLGFAVAVHIRPDVLLVDEVLAVGDEDFQRKCLQASYGFVRRGGTLVLVSHSAELIRDMCRRAIWLDDGRIRGDGPTPEIIGQYLQHIHGREQERLEQHRADEAHRPVEIVPATAAEPEPTAGEPAAEKLRWGDRAVSIEAVRLLDGAGRVGELFYTGAALRIELDYVVRQPLAESPVIGFAFVRQDGIWCYGTNTRIDEVSTAALLESGRERGTISIVLDHLSLLPGEYTLDLALQSPQGSDHDYWRACARLSVRSNVRDTGVARLTHTWAILPRSV